MPKYRRVFEEGHSYSITVVTHQRNPILIDNIDLLRESFRVSKAKFSYCIDAIVILPDHFHMLITPENATDYPKIVSTIKSYFSRHCDSSCYAHLEQSFSRHKSRYKPVWQKKYYEHTIRNEKDWLYHIQYIHTNPVKHSYVTHADKWPHSSYHLHQKTQTP